MISRNEAFSAVFKHFTGRELHIDEDQNIFLELDIGLDGDREFVQSFSELKFPDLKSLKIINFMECDEDVESLLAEKAPSVQILHLAADGY